MKPTTIRNAALLAAVATLSSACGGGSHDANVASDAPPDPADPAGRIDAAGPFDAASQRRYGCGSIATPRDEGRLHVPATRTVRYASNPPTSGPHWNDPTVPAPAEWGVYDQPLRDEQLVHNLEHGHVVVSYRGIDARATRLLRSQVDEVAYHLVLVPRPANPRPGVYYTAWGRSLHCERPDPDALQHFVDEFRDQGPEVVMDDPSSRRAP